MKHNKHQNGPTDSLGQPLKLGDLIAYAVGAGRSQVLNFYEIDRINATEADIWNQSKGKHEPGIEYSIRGRYLGGHAWRYGKTRQFSTLYYPGERMVKLPKSTKLPKFDGKGHIEDA